MSGYWTLNVTLKTAWSDKSRLLPRYIEGRVRVWQQQHESIDSTCLVETVKAGGGAVMMWGMIGTLWAR